MTKEDGKLLKRSAYRTLVSVLIAVVIFLIFLASVRVVFGIEYPFMVVVSNSMYPTLKINDLIIVQKVDPRDLKIGDIIVFYHPYNKNDRIVHRIYGVISYNPPAFLTKGDNNPYPDHWIVTKDLIVGKVVAVIPYIGVIPRAFMPPYNYYTIILIIFLIFLIELISEYKKGFYSKIEKSLKYQIV